MPDSGPADQRKSTAIDLALSGGGHRATAFAIGALLYLCDAGLTRQIRCLASVSGGSIANAYLAANVDLDRATPDEVRACLLRLGGIVARRNALAPDRRALLRYLPMLLMAMAGLTALAGVCVVGWWPARCLLLGAGLVLLGFAPAGRDAALTAAVERTFDLPEQMPAGARHVLCATELGRGEPFYFIGPTVYSPSLGRGTNPCRPAQAVCCSAAFPGLFRPFVFRSEHFGFTGPSPRRLTLCDGGVSNNLAHQWFEGAFSRMAGGHADPAELHTSSVTLVLDASAGPRSWPGVGAPHLLSELRLFARQVSVMYDNTLLPRTEALRLGAVRGTAGRPVLIGRLAADPANLAASLTLTRDQGPRAARVQAFLAQRHAELAQAVTANRSVPTTLNRLGIECVAQLVQHGYATAMAALACGSRVGVAMPVPAVDDLVERLLRPDSEGH